MPLDPTKMPKKKTKTTNGAARNTFCASDVLATAFFLFFGSRPGVGGITTIAAVACSREGNEHGIYLSY